MELSKTVKTIILAVLLTALLYYLGLFLIRTYNSRTEPAKIENKQQ